MNSSIKNKTSRLYLMNQVATYHKGVGVAKRDLSLTDIGEFVKKIKIYIPCISEINITIQCFVFIINTQMLTINNEPIFQQ